MIPDNDTLYIAQIYYYVLSTSIQGVTRRDTVLRQHLSGESQKFVLYWFNVGSTS